MFSDELNDVNVSLIYINRSTWSKQISEHARNQKVPTTVYENTTDMYRYTEHDYSTLPQVVLR